MKKKRIITLVSSMIIIALTLVLGLRLPGKAYYLTSTLIIIEIFIPLFLTFERHKPKARELSTLAVMCALAVVGRAAIPFPNFKAIFAIIIICAISFGPEAGFLTGAVSAFVSNFFYGQGPYTPWQMAAYGVVGLIAGLLFGKKLLKSKPVVMAVFGLLSVVLVAGPLLDTCSAFLTLSPISPAAMTPFYISGFFINLGNGICTFLFLLILGKPMLQKLQRMRAKYGIMEDSNGI